MKSLGEYLRTMGRRLLLPPRRLEAIAAIDPSHVYVENVRAVFGISTALAKRLCEMAVNQGVAERRVQVLCPDKVVAAEAETEQQLPPRVRCWQETKGDYEEVVYETGGLQKLEFYVFKREGAA